MGCLLVKETKPPTRFEDMEDWKKDEFHNISSSNLVNLTLYYKEYGLFLFFEREVTSTTKLGASLFSIGKKTKCKINIAIIYSELYYNLSHFCWNRSLLW